MTNPYADLRSSLFRARTHIEKMLATDAGFKEACCRIKLVVNSAIKLHEDGIPLHKLKNNGTYTTSRYKIDDTSRCLGRVRIMISAVSKNKLVGKDVLTIDRLVELAWSPDKYLTRKLNNLHGNNMKGQYMKFGRDSSGLVTPQKTAAGKKRKNSDDNTGCSSKRTDRTAVSEEAVDASVSSFFDNDALGMDADGIDWDNFGTDVTDLYGL